MDAIIFMTVAYLTITSMLVLINANNKKLYIISIILSVLSIFVILSVLFKYQGCFIPVVINFVFILSGTISYRRVLKEDYITYILDKDDYEIVFDVGYLTNVNTFNSRECTIIKWKDHTFITQIPIIGSGDIKLTCDSNDRVISVNCLNKFDTPKLFIIIDVLLLYLIPIPIYLGYLNGDFRMYSQLVGNLTAIVMFLFLLSMMCGKALTFKTKVLRFIISIMTILLVIGSISELLVIFNNL